MRQVSLRRSGTAESAPGARGQSYMSLPSVHGRAVPDVGDELVTSGFIHASPQEQIDAPDASDAESLVPQITIEAGDSVFGQFCQ